MRLLLLLAALVAGWFFLGPEVQRQGWTPVSQSFSLCGASDARSDGCVVDGDTLIIGFGPNRRRIRLTGFDAPELESACEEESRLAIAARDRLRDWLAEGPFEWDGAEDPPYDQYGRELRALRRARGDGSHDYLAETMIESGLAAETGWGTQERDWCN